MSKTAFKFARHKGAQVTFSGMALFYGFAFFAAAISGWDAMFPSQFGDTAVKAEVEAWAGAQLGASVILAMGLMINGRWRWSPALRLAGATVISALCWGLAVSAFTAPEGWPVAVYCAGFGGLGAIVAWWNLVDLRAAIFWGHDA